MEELNLELGNLIGELLELRGRYSEALGQAKALSWDHAKTERILRQDWEMRARQNMRLANMKNWTAANRRTLLAGLRERLEGCITFLDREAERGDLAPGFVAELQTELANLIQKHAQGMERERRREDALFKLVARLRQLEKEGPFREGA